MYIKYRQRVYSVLRIRHVPVLVRIAYVIAYSTLLHHLVLCVDHKMAMIETGLYYKKIKHVFAGHQNYSELDIMFLSTFIYLPVFVFVLINKSTAHNTY